MINLFNHTVARNGHLEDAVYEKLDAQEAVPEKLQTRKPSDESKENARFTRTQRNNLNNCDPRIMKINLKVPQRSFGFLQKTDLAILEKVSINFNDQNSRSKTAKKGIIDKTEPI